MKQKFIQIFISKIKNKIQDLRAEKMIDSKLIILIAILAIANFDYAQSCFLDSTCLPSQYCEMSFPNPIGIDLKKKSF